MLQEDVEDVVKEEKKSYDQALQEGAKFPAGSDVDLDMRVLLVHGDDLIADSSESGLTAACDTYKLWLKTLDC